jgi:hypothetical protein
MEIVHSRCCGIDVHKETVLNEHGRTPEVDHIFFCLAWP